MLKNANGIYFSKGFTFYSKSNIYESKMQTGSLVSPNQLKVRIFKKKDPSVNSC